MKNKLTGLLGMMLAGTLALGSMGCQFDPKKGGELLGANNYLSDQQVFEIADNIVTLPMVRLLLVNNMSLHGQSYGIDLLKNRDLKVQKRFEQYVKELTMQEMTEVYCLVALAESKQVTLDEEEQQLAGWAAEDYIGSLSESDQQVLGISQEELTDLFENYALASKVCQSLVMNVNKEVSDDEARVMRVRQIFQTDEERAKKAQEDLNAGVEFSSVAANYNEAEEINLTLMRGELPKEAEQAAFSLENDTFSPLIATADGYYIFYCENKYDEELTEIHKADIVSQRKQKAFEDVYLPFVPTVQSRLNEEAWDAVSTKELLDLKITDFYQIYEKYFGKSELPM